MPWISFSNFHSIFGLCVLVKMFVYQMTVQQSWLYLMYYVCIFEELHSFGHGAAQGSRFVGNILLSWTLATYSFPFASLNYLSPFLPPDCSTPVSQMDIEAGSHCWSKMGGCCLLRSLWNCISVWRPCFQRKLLLYCFPHIPQAQKGPSKVFFFRFYNNFVQQQRRVERKSINCALSPSRPSAQVPESQ